MFLKCCILFQRNANKRVSAECQTDQREQNMSEIVLTHRVEDVAKWKSFDDERSANLGAFATNIKSHVDVDGGDLVALTMTITDRDGMRAYMKSDACGAIMKQHGVIQPVNMMKHGR